MLKLPHSIRTQTIELAVDSEALALALQPRMSDVNRRHFLPVIQRVLDEFDVSGRHIRIDRLEVNLGRLPLARFEEEAAERLDIALRKALSEVLRRPGGSSQPEGATRLELLEHYLLRGTLPFWAPRAVESSLEMLFLELIEAEPEGVAALVRRLGRQRSVLERIVLCFGESLLRRLLHLLEPEHAALILAYMLDLRDGHRVEPILPLGDRPFTRLVWLLVLSYLVEEPGSQFNRKSFVKSLLEGMAASEGLSYAEITRTLRLGLRKTVRRLPLKSSLPAVIEQLVYELDRDAAAGSVETGRASERARASLKEGTAAAEDESKEGDDAEAEGGTAASAGADADAEDRPTCDDALACLERYLTDEEEAATRKPPAEGPGHAPGTPTTRDDAMWRDVLAAMLHESPGRPSLSASVRRAFEVSAARLGVSPAQLAEALERAPGLKVVEAETGPARETHGLLAHEPHEPLTDETRELLARALRAVRARKPQGALGLGQPGRLRPPELARAVFARYDLLEVLRYYLDEGVLPWVAVLREPALTAESVVACLPGLSRPALRRLLARADPAEQLRAVLRAVEKLPDGGVAKLLVCLLPRAGGEGGALLTSLQAFASEGEGEHAFYARVIVAILDGRPVDLEELSAAGPLPPALELILPANPAEWEPHLLKSAVLNRLRFGDTTFAGRHTHEDLLRALLVQHPGEARHFLRAVGSVQPLRAAFVKKCPTSLLDRGLQLLCPHWAESLRALALSFTRIAAPYRPLGEEEARSLIFGEALRTRAGEPLTAHFFLRVLRRLFAMPLPERVGEVLLHEAGSWATRGDLPAEHAAAFESAVRTAAAVPNARDAEPSPDEERQEAEELADDFTRASVFAFLLGGSATLRKAEPSSHRGPAPPRQEPLPRDALLHELERMIDESPSEVYDFIRQHMTDSLSRERWVTLLPEAMLVRLSYLLEPQKHRALLDAAEVLDTAWAEAAPTGHPSLYGRGVFWNFLLEFLGRSSGPTRSTEQLVAAFFEYYAARYLAAVPGAPDRARIGAGMLEHATQIARGAGQAGLLALLRRERALLLAPWESSAAAARPPAPDAKAAARHGAQEEEPPRPVPRRGRTAFGMTEDKEEAVTETIYIDNAGLVLTGPFLPAFFQSLGLLGEDERGVPRLRDHAAASRAVHLLQFLVDGRTSAPEPSLVLNKILCGIPTGVAVEREIELTAAERECCERLLKSVIANWKVIEHTSIAGLQETFFRREGRLERSASTWKLKVQRKTLDVLVDQIPWSISVAYHRWMPQPLYVDW
jgi:hypothetical protein